jgi:hypothetical protein
MPKAKRQPKPQRRTPPARLRVVPLQVFLSEDEHAKLCAKLERYQCSASELVRRWILAEPRRRAKTQAHHPPDDPRQVTVSEILSTTRD